MAARWSAGDCVVLRAVGPLTVGKPAVVVEDSAERVMLYVPHGVHWLGPAVPSGDRVKMIRAFAKGERVIALDMIPWRNHVLHILLPGRPFSVWLFWSSEWEFLFYYVNLETPFTRSTVGFDTCDHVLDICVRPDRTWYYKDLDELEVCVEVGLMSAAMATDVRRDAGQAVALIEAWQPPFDAGLEHWRPSPAWPLPLLPAGWQAHGSETRPWVQFPSG
ncbi:MAG: DUF402 domain-containing protein [Spirochaetaceae bacterium]|nr:DUF402 domain-containing protein [Spirochaetaceae bacterium]